MSDHTELITAVIKRIHTLPSLPEVALTLTRLVNDPATTGAKVAELISRDPAISAKVLRIVNGPTYGRSTPVRDLQEAVSLLGLKTLRSLVVSLSFINTNVGKTPFNMPAFWMHSTIAASLCRSITTQTKTGDPELYYLIGLMRSIGRIVMAQNLPDETAAILELANKSRRSFHLAANELVGTNDAEVGAWLAGKWELEQAIIDGLRFQYDLEQSPDQKVVPLLRLAEFLCHRKGIRACGDFDTPLATPDDIRAIGLDGPSLQAVIGTLESELAKAKELLANSA